MKAPDFIILGAMKSGTTPFLQMMLQHPQIESPKLEKANHEVHFFDQQIEKGMTIEQYYKLFDGTCCGEKTPNYLFLPQCAPRIAKYAPDAKLIVILRNPVDRAYSNYHFSKRRDRTEATSFKEWLELENQNEELSLNLPLDHRTYRPPNHSLNYGFRKGLYAQQIKKYFEYFPKSQFHFIINERIRVDYVQELNRVAEFLNLETFDSWEKSERNTTKYKPMGDWIKQKLYKQYEQPNQELFELLGFEIPEWKMEN